MGEYFNDTLAMGAVIQPSDAPPLQLKNATMAVAAQAVFQTSGVWGIGFDTVESEDILFEVSYPNIIDEMVSQGLISHRGYSLWLDDLGSSSLSTHQPGC